MSTRPQFPKCHVVLWSKSYIGLYRGCGHKVDRRSPPNDSETFVGERFAKDNFKLEDYIMHSNSNNETPASNQYHNNPYHSIKQSAMSSKRRNNLTNAKPIIPYHSNEKDNLIIKYDKISFINSLNRILPKFCIIDFMSSVKFINRILSRSPSLPNPARSINFSGRILRR